MDAGAKPGSSTPWYLRLKTLIITAGALAAAIASVITLGNLLSNNDENDVSDIPSVTVIEPMMLSEFETDKLGGELPLQPDPDAAGGAPYGVNVLAGALLAVATPSPRDEVEPMPSTTETSGTTPPTPTPVPTSTVTPTPFPTSTVTPTPVPEELAVAMAARPELQGKNIRPSDAGLLRTVPILDPKPGDPSRSSPGPSSSAETLSPDQEIDRLLEAFAAVEGGDPATLNPQGYLVTVKLLVKGFEGERLMLTYSLDPKVGSADIPESWSADNLAYYMTPTTPEDSGVADLWVPDLVAPGPYVVNVELWAVEENVKIAAGQSDPID